MQKMNASEHLNEKFMVGVDCTTLRLHLKQDVAILVRVYGRTAVNPGLFLATANA